MSALSDAVNQLQDAAAIAADTLDGDSNDDEHEALVGLIAAAHNVIESWLK